MSLVLVGNAIAVKKLLLITAVMPVCLLLSNPILSQTLDPDGSELTLETLLRNDFVDYEFYPNNKYVTLISGMDSYEAGGLYELTDGELLIYGQPIELLDDNKDKQRFIDDPTVNLSTNRAPLRYGNGKLRYDRNAPDYTIYIELIDNETDDIVTIPIVSTEVKEGDAMKLDGAASVRLGNDQWATATANLFCRQNPSVDADPVPIYEILFPHRTLETEYIEATLDEEAERALWQSLERDNRQVKEHPYIPKGRTFGVIARTAIKYRVDDTDAHWFYVKHRYSINKPCWVFGAFVDLSD